MFPSQTEIKAQTLTIITTFHHATKSTTTPSQAYHSPALAIALVTVILLDLRLCLCHSAKALYLALCNGMRM